MTSSCIDTERRIYAPINEGTIDSDDNLSPKRSKIIWKNAGLLMIGAFGGKSSEIWNNTRISFHENVVYKMTSTFFRSHYLSRGGSL